MYEKTNIPPSNICFFCRVRQHLSVWTFGKFKKTKSDLSGDSLITVLSARGNYPLYTRTEWNSDTWDALDYGTPYDPSRSFFEQMKILQSRVPRPHQVGSNSIGCDWCDDVWNSKNCYLSRSMEECEDLYYSYRMFQCKNSIDITFCFTTEYSYDCTNCTKCYKLFYSEDSQNCVESYFLYDCKNCTDCFMSWNLRNKQYCIENVQYTKEEYKEKLKKYNLSSHSSVTKLKQQFQEILKQEAIHRNRMTINAVNSTGNYLTNVSNIYRGFMFSEAQDVCNILRGIKVRDGIDVTGCWYGEKIGNISCCTNVFDARYSSWCDNLRYSEYCDLCIETEYCFGCIGLRKKKYCILNKQYSKEEYETLRAQIIADMKARGEYGKFLPYSLATEPYNFSTGMFYLPETTKEMIESLGGSWEEIHEDRADGLSTDKLPDDIHDVTDDVCTQPLVCPITGWKFNVAQGELQFYRQNNIPLPRVHFDVRTKNRLIKMTVLKSETYTCIFCQKDTEAYYPHTWGYEKIACEECYLKNVA